MDNGQCGMVGHMLMTIVHHMENDKDGGWMLVDITGMEDGIYEMCKANVYL